MTWHSDLAASRVGQGQTFSEHFGALDKAKHLHAEIQCASSNF